MCSGAQQHNSTTAQQHNTITAHALNYSNVNVNKKVIQILARKNLEIS